MRSTSTVFVMLFDNIYIIYNYIILYIYIYINERKKKEVSVIIEKKTRTDHNCYNNDMTFLV